MVTLQVGEKLLYFDLFLLNSQIVQVRVRDITQRSSRWIPILGMNSRGEVWRYPNLPADLGLRLNKEGKILEIR